MGNVFRGFNKFVLIDANSGLNRVPVYQVTPLLGRMTTGYLVDIQLTVSINSIAEFVFVPNDTKTDSQISRDYEVAANSAPKKNLLIQMSNDGNTWVDVLRIPIYSKLPYYQIDLISRLTEQSHLVVGETTRLAMQLESALAGIDRISILVNGSEETYNPFE